MAEQLQPVLPKISEIQAKFVILWLQTPIRDYCAEELGVSLSAVHRWLNQKKVKTHLAHFRGKIPSKCPYTLIDVASEAARIGFFDIKKVIPEAEFNNTTKEVTIKLEDWAKVDGRVVKSVKQDIKDGCEVLRLTFHDKISALKLLQENLRGNEGEKHLHVHLTPEDLEKRDIHGAADAYRELMGN